MTDGTTTLWDSNGGANYETSVNAGTLAINWIGQTYHWPTNGALNQGDDLWINIQSSPVNAGIGGTVVYSINGSTNWFQSALNHNGVVGQTDAWNANLGAFTAGDTIEYAVKVTDTTLADHWDNNNNNNYQATVNQLTSSITWFGNATGRGAPQPVLDLSEDQVNDKLVLHVNAAKNGAGYSILVSSNLNAWSSMDYASATDSNMNVDLYANFSSMDVERAYYAVRVDEYPAGPIYETDCAVISIESTPPGGAIAATLVFSLDGGSTWGTAPMQKTGVVNGNDEWMADLGEQPQGTTIKFAIELLDDESNAHWDNNGGNDHSVNVQ